MMAAIVCDHRTFSTAIHPCFHSRESTCSASNSFCVGQTKLAETSMPGNRRLIRKSPPYATSNILQRGKFRKALRHAKRDVRTLVRWPCSSSNTHRRLSRLSYRWLNFERWRFLSALRTGRLASCLLTISTAPSRTPGRRLGRSPPPRSGRGRQAPRAPIRAYASRDPP